MIAEQIAPAPKLLVVDDSESNLYVVSTWLRRAGYEIAEARTGQEALDLLAASRFDLAILDVNLPDMTGYDVCERIKSTGETASIPVLHISATATNSADRSEGLRRGAEGFLVEPVEREELIATVEALLRAAAAQHAAVHLSQRLRLLNEAVYAINNVVGLQPLIGVIAEQAALLFDAPAAVATVCDSEPVWISASPGAPPQRQAGNAESIAALAFEADNLFEFNGAAIHELCPNLPDARKYLAQRLTGEQLGVLVVNVRESAQSDIEENAAVLGAFARSAGTALRNMRSYDTERRIALKLQENLLPDDVPPNAGLEIATRYAAGAEHAEVGGDFYEIFPLGGDRIAIAIGDVVGHSLEAATIMAQLRTAIRCFALEGHAPDAVLERLNRLLEAFHPTVTATACYGVYDAATGRFEFANAGHPPLLHGTGNGWSPLPLGGILLGVDAPAPQVQSVELRPGDMLLFYTDGVVERRGEDFDAGLARIIKAAAGAGSLSALCDALVREAGAAIDDDIALVAVRRLA